MDKELEASHRLDLQRSVGDAGTRAMLALLHAKQDRIGCEYLSRFPSPESLWNWWVMDEFCPPKQCGEMKLFEPEDEHGGA